jgi:hypothetical protein
MTRQEIEEIAIQAGIKSYVLGMATEEAWQQTERFVELILKKGEEKFADRLKEEREKEREACAKVVEANVTEKFLEWHAEVVKLAILAERDSCARIADEEAQLFGITDDVVAHRIRERGEDRFEIKEDRIHKDLPGRRVAKAAGARNKE